MKKTHRKFQLWLAALFVALMTSGYSAEVSISMQPKSFPVGRGGQLSIIAEGGSFDTPPNPPTPPGVTIRPYGQSRNVRIINGRMTQSLTQNYVVSADRAGDYTIPSFEVEIGGQTLKTDPVTFQVTAGTSPQPGNSQQPSAAADSDQTPGFIRLDFPKREREHLYVGEMAPVRIKAYFPPNTQVSLQSTPKPEGKGFTLHNLSDEPEQSTEILNGKRYRTVTWFAGISVAKAGEYPISVGLDATVMVKDTSPQGRRSSPFDSFFGGNSPFNDPFFDDFFDNAFTRTIPREVSLKSPGDPLIIKSLPDEGRPANFSGAVGEFSLGGYRLPAEAQTGEPQKIRVTVNGKGNFDRLSAPTLEPAADWKTYKPKTEFSPGDVASFSGSKTFDFNAVPQKSGDQSISLAFSYFNPTTGTYETVTSETIDLTISGADVVSDATVTTGAQSSGSPQSAPKSTATELAPNRKISNTYVSLTPLLYSTGYWTIVSIALLGIASGFAWTAIRKHQTDPVRVAEKHAIRQEQQALELAEQAAASGDVKAFFEHARRSLQERYGALWNRSPEAITVSELRTNLPGDSATIEIFRRADELAYAPAGETNARDLPEWNRKLKEALDTAV